MTAATAPAFRTFTREQSSAIHNLHVERGGFVEVIFQSNPSRAYGFTATPAFCEFLIAAISYADLPYSVGKMIADARKNGNLTPIQD